VTSTVEHGLGSAARARGVSKSPDETMRTGAGYNQLCGSVQINKMANPPPRLTRGALFGKGRGLFLRLRNVRIDFHGRHYPSRRLGSSV